jgi:xylulokinase
MQPTYVIGVDLGTSATKTAIYKIDGTLAAESSIEVPLAHPSPGVVEQNPEDFYSSAAQTVRACMESAGVEAEAVKAIAFDSQMAGLGLIDEDFRPVGMFDSWLDMRCQPYIELMNREAGDRITQLTGCPPTCDHGPKILWWMHERPREYRRTAKFLMPGAYVAGRLGGLPSDRAFIDHTYIHFSGFSNAEEGAWSAELCQRFGLDPEKLPRIVDPCEVVGEARPDAARDFGLAPGTLIVAGAGDTAANALGAGIVRRGMLFDVAGTAAVLAGCTDRFVPDRRHQALLTMRSAIPGLWHPLAYIAGGGIALRWFRDEFFNTSVGAKLPPDDEAYDRMISLTEHVAAGSDGLLFSPHLGGRICPSSPEMRGAWVGISWSHTQAHFARAILEGIAYEYAYYLKILRSLLPDLDLVEARVTGGGARSSRWNQLKADILGVPYQRLAGKEFGTWGAALIAARGAGLIDDLASHAEKCAIREGEALIPSNERRQAYAPVIERYIELETTLNRYFTSQPSADGASLAPGD